MEARATFGSAKSSRTVVGAFLVVLAMAVGATGGYMAANLSSAKVVVSTHNAAPAAQSNVPAAVLPDYIQKEIAPATPAPRLSQDSPEFIQKYGQYSWVPGTEYAIP